MRARAPGSVTGLYAPPREEGGPSRGASVAIADGVVVDVEPADAIEITVEGEPAPFEPVANVLEALDATARVDVRPEVPLGHGFGASGAATLATALAAGEAFDLAADRESLLWAAHRAEVQAGTGNGDVFVQDRGGMVWSAADGSTGRQELDEPVEYASAGGIETAAMLDDESFMAAAREHGHRQLELLGAAPTLRTLAERSRAYLDGTGLATEFVEDALARVQSAGGAGSMALFGDTVFAVDVEGVLDARTTVSNEGARVIDD